MRVPDNHIVSVILSNEDVKILAAISETIEPPASKVIKRIVYQANDSPIFCSAHNKPIKHLNPSAATCQPFPFACNTCPMALYEE